MNSVILLSSQNGDWEGLFVNNELVAEGHQLGEGSYRYFWMTAPIDFGFNPKDLKYKEVVDEDEEYLDRYGNFPKQLNSLKGKY